MSECRDWLATLWPASFKGFPFFLDSDEEEGGRSLKVHEFPHRDDPFVEDLGQAPRIFKGSAYISGDLADIEALAFSELLASPGSGILMLPSRGPVQVRCKTFARKNEKDKLGYIAYSVEFVREGAPLALP